VDAHIWIKGETLDIKGLLESLAGREMIMKKQMAVEQKRRTDQEEL
jgi:hypothetical protein